LIFLGKKCQSTEAAGFIKSGRQLTGSPISSQDSGTHFRETTRTSKGKGGEEAADLEPKRVSIYLDSDPSTVGASNFSEDQDGNEENCDPASEDDRNKAGRPEIGGVPSNTSE
jgi:hypothetical protein